jgi:hypothetical protein
MRTHIKRLLLVVLCALSISCAPAVTVATEAPPSEDMTFPDGTWLSCTVQEGYEYYCYSDKECQAYLSGYAAIVKERFVAQQRGWFIDNGPVQVIHVNLFAEHTGLLLVGRMEAEAKDGRIFLKYWGIICGLDLTIEHSFYKEGLTKTILE